MGDACSCECDWDGGCVVGTCEMGWDQSPYGKPDARTKLPRHCRQDGWTCHECGHHIEIGERIVDHTGVIEDWGWFFRYHYACFAVKALWADFMCGGCWEGRLNTDEAARHAVTWGHEDRWRRWLLLYEETWPWTEPDQLRPPEHLWGKRIKTQMDDDGRLTSRPWKKGEE